MIQELQQLRKIGYQHLTQLKAKLELAQTQLLVARDRVESDKITLRDSFIVSQKKEADVLAIQQDIDNLTRELEGAPAPATAPAAPVEAPAPVAATVAAQPAITPQEPPPKIAGIPVELVPTLQNGTTYLRVREFVKSRSPSDRFTVLEVANALLRNGECVSPTLVGSILNRLDSEGLVKGFGHATYGLRPVVSVVPSLNTTPAQVSTPEVKATLTTQGPAGSDPMIQNLQSPPAGMRWCWKCNCTGTRAWNELNSEACVTCLLDRKSAVKMVLVSGVTPGVFPTIFHPISSAPFSSLSIVEDNELLEDDAEEDGATDESETEVVVTNVFSGYPKGSRASTRKILDYFRNETLAWRAKGGFVGDSVPEFLISLDDLEAWATAQGIVSSCGRTRGLLSQVVSSLVTGGYLRRIGKGVYTLKEAA